MLKQRLLTAAVLIPLMIGSILWLPPAAFAVLLGSVVTIAAWEWAALCGWQTAQQRWGYAAVMAVSLAVLYGAQAVWPTLTATVLALGLTWWCVAIYWVVSYQRHRDVLPHSARLRAGLGWLILAPSWLALFQLHAQYGGTWVLFLFVLIWVADSGAYAAGRLWGRHKLADQVSPGKTWEGVLGALVASLLASVLFAGAWHVWSLSTVFSFLLLCFGTVLISILGDLLESLFKRKMNVKDSSHILPGHGGILDRIDSLTSAAPFFLAGLLVLGSLS